MQLHRFTDAGLERFSAFLDSLTTDSPQPYPSQALAHGTHSQVVSEDVSIECQVFATRFELASSLHSAFVAADFKPALSDKHLWAWIACFLFNEICPKDKHGQLQPGARQRWIPDLTDFRRYYRHLVAGPYSIFAAHADDPARAMAVLCQPPGRPGDVVEQLVSRQEIIASPQIMQVATALFYDAESRRQRRGAGGKGAGSARRLVDVLAQFDVTWDLASIPGAGLQGMLPKEFRR